MASWWLCNQRKFCTTGCGLVYTVGVVSWGLLPRYRGIVADWLNSTPLYLYIYKITMSVLCKEGVGASNIFPNVKLEKFAIRYLPTYSITTTQLHQQLP